ncbi:transglycosylase SLT domain-containing protein [Swingsia samuiensis]|uniref:transglycosylase SLT domain-containing protein n=1 Tax=Swingsia samuiensis TaxID=1293412 RepID=UPI001FE7DFCE|nr:transglycosylase SLT domain-containing protein [Swingsia samuiensis]
MSVLILAGGTFHAGCAASVRPLPPQPDHAGDETAFAEIQIPAHGGDAVGLPHPLTAADASRYRAIFQAQRRGDTQTAIEQTRLLKNTVLLGDVLADRYLMPNAHPNVEQLKAWLRTYPTSPDAANIQKVLVGLAPAGSVQVQNFTKSLSPEDRPDTVHLPDGKTSDPLSKAFTRNPLLDRTVQERVASGEKGAMSALHLIDVTPGMTGAYASQLYGEVALSLLAQGATRSALRIGCEGFEKGKHQVGLAAYVAGLSAWREGHTDTAYELFQSAANSPVTSSELHAAAAFWAARSKARSHAVSAYVSWLHRAANHHDTFYGMLASQTLEQGRKGHAHLADVDMEVTLHDPVPVLSEIDVEAIGALAQGQQLYALLQVGERGRAEDLMRRMWPDLVADSARSRSLQLVAQAAGFEDLSEQMASLIMSVGAHPKEETEALPFPNLHPRNGFRMDPALVYALTRVESNFDSMAASGAGAHGLMQIRPITASFVTQSHPVYDAHGQAVINIPADMVARLHNPSMNLEIGQLYVIYLAHQSDHAGISATQAGGGDLVRVLASYNAGPGAIARWESNQSSSVHDPLFFIETLPNAETRDYVHKTLTYTWRYAKKMGMAAPSLKSLTRAEWPSFKAERALAQEHIALN